MANISLILSALLEVELAMEALYTWCAQQPQQDPPTAATLLRLAADERSHADLLRFQLNLVARDRASFPDVALDARELQQTAARVQAFLRGRPTPTLGEALGFAIAVERSAAEQHYRGALALSNPDLARLLKTLGAGDEAHVSAVEDLARQRFA